MSLLKKLGSFAKAALPTIAPMIPGPLGVVAKIGAAGVAARSAAAVLPGVGAASSFLPALPTVARGAGLVVGTGIRLGRNVAASAMTYCRRHPAWCAAAGGVGAVESMIRGGQLPPIKRRRARGITGTELKNFRRVSRVLDRWCKTPAPRKPRGGR